MLPMGVATAGTAWSGYYPLAFSGRRLGMVSPEACFMLNTRSLNYRALSVSRLLGKLGVSKSQCELQHDFQYSNSNRYLNGRNILLLVGLDFRSAPREALEKLAVSDSGLPCAIDKFLRAGFIKEAAILSTPDQFEIYMAECIGVEKVFEWIAKRSGIPAAELRKWCYIIDHENHVARHLFEVASGLHSHFWGEGQILEQMEVVLTSLKGAETFGRKMDKLFNTAVSVGRVVKSQIDLSSSGRASVGSAAVNLTSSKLRDTAGSDDTREIEEMVQHNNNNKQHNRLWKSVEARPYIDQQVGEFESWMNKQETVDFMMGVLSNLNVTAKCAVIDVVTDKLEPMGDEDKPLRRDVLEKLSFEMWTSFCDVMLARMLGPDFLEKLGGT